MPSNSPDIIYNFKIFSGVAPRNPPMRGGYPLSYSPPWRPSASTMTAYGGHRIAIPHFIFALPIPLFLAKPLISGGC